MSERNRNVKNHFDFYKEDNPYNYNEYHFSFYRKMISMIKEDISCETLYDIGCGEGYFLKILLETQKFKFNNLFCIDLVDKVLPNLKKNIDRDLKFVVSNIEKDYKDLNLFNIKDNTVLFIENLYYYRNPILFLKRFVDYYNPKNIVVMDSLKAAYIRRCLYKNDNYSLSSYKIRKYIKSNGNGLYCVVYTRK